MSWQPSEPTPRHIVGIDLPPTRRPITETVNANVGANCDSAVVKQTELGVWFCAGDAVVQLQQQA